MDETAYPIILAWQLRSYDPALAGSAYYTSHILPAASYNHDGYGETPSGGDYTGAGAGPLWPLLTGEYAQYQDLLGASVSPYVSDLQRFANPSHLLSEQVWDTGAPAGDTPGTPTMSMSEIGRAHV